MPCNIRVFRCTFAFLVTSRMFLAFLVALHLSCYFSHFWWHHTSCLKIISPCSSPSHTHTLPMPCLDYYIHLNAYDTQFKSKTNIPSKGVETRIGFCWPSTRSETGPQHGYLTLRGSMRLLQINKKLSVLFFPSIVHVSFTMSRNRTVLTELWLIIIL